MLMKSYKVAFYPIKTLLAKQQAINNHSISTDLNAASTNIQLIFWK